VLVYSLPDMCSEARCLPRRGIGTAWPSPLHVLDGRQWFPSPMVLWRGAPPTMVAWERYRGGDRVVGTGAMHEGIGSTREKIRCGGLRLLTTIDFHESWCTARVIHRCGAYRYLLLER
jgi:hypothetical protein